MIHVTYALPRIDSPERWRRWLLSCIEVVASKVVVESSADIRVLRRRLRGTSWRRTASSRAQGTESTSADSTGDDKRNRNAHSGPDSSGGTGTANLSKRR